MVEQAKALHRATNKPTKIQYTGVQVLAQCTNDLHYRTAATARWRIAKAMNEDILEVDALGIDFIQLDEFTWPYFYEDWAIEAFNTRGPGRQERQDHRACLLGQLGRHAGLLSRRDREGGRDFRPDQAQGQTLRAVGDPLGRAEVLRGQDRRAQPRELRSPRRRSVRPRRPQAVSAARRMSTSGPASST